MACEKAAAGRIASALAAQKKRRQRDAAKPPPSHVLGRTRRQVVIGLISAPFVLRSVSAQPLKSSSVRVINMHNAPRWVAKNYTAKQRVISGRNAYECVTGGVGTTAPTGSSAVFQDGPLAWKFLSGVDYTDIMSMLAFFYNMASTPNNPTWTQPIEVHFWNDSEWVWAPSGYETQKLGRSQDHAGYPLGSSASCPLVITAAPGESFRDHPNVRSNALNYNPANGAAITGGTGSAFTIIHLDKDFVTIRGLQFKSTHRFGIEGDQTSFNFNINGCILSGSCWIISGDYIIENCLVLGGVTSSYGLRCYNNTIIAGPQPIYVQYSEHEKYVRNCLVYGVGAGPMYNTLGNQQIVANHCQTDMANPPAGFMTAGKAADQFVNPVTDFRLKTGARAIGAGAADSTVGPKDISGQTHPQNGKWDIGCWQS